MLVNSIDNPQFLDFIMSDTENSGSDYKFEWGEWTLTSEKDDKFLSFTWPIRISKIFNRNQGTVQVKIKDELPREIVLLDGSYQVHVIRITLSH